MCVPPDPGIDAAALGASESALPGTSPAEALHTFTLDSGASCRFFCDNTTLTPLPAPIPVRLADPSEGLGSCPFHHCSPVSGGSVRLTVRSSPPLVLYELGEYRCPPGCDGHYHHSWGSSCGISALVTPPCNAFMACTPASLFLVFPGLCLPSRPRLPPPDFLASRGGSGREHYFLLVVDDYTRYTMVFFLRSKGEVVDVLIPWIRTVRLKLRERFGTDLPVLRLHSDRGGEFSSDLLRDFCHGEGILQSFTLPASP
ncbi:unnamed protein product [Closterium sp. NIES-53]